MPFKSSFVIVIVISKLLKRHSKANRRAPAYSRALRQIRGVFQRIVRAREAQVRLPEGERRHIIGVKAGVVYRRRVGRKRIRWVRERVFEEVGLQFRVESPGVPDRGAWWRWCMVCMPSLSTDRIPHDRNPPFRTSLLSYLPWRHNLSLTNCGISSAWQPSTGNRQVGLP